MTKPGSVLLELQYFPPLPYFAMLAKYETVWIEQHEHYVKGSYRNRCHIAAVNGVQRLSVPLRKGKNQQQPIREVRIAYDEPWQAQLWQAIQSAYGNSPFFEHYADFYQPFFRQKFEFLFDLNYELLVLTLRLLRLRCRLSLTESYQQTPPEGIEDFRQVVHPKNAPGQGVSPFRYPQVFEDRHGFLPNLCILDLLFCCGNEAGNVLNQIIVK
jgi:hypothetical protein